MGSDSDDREDVDDATGGSDEADTGVYHERWDPDDPDTVTRAVVRAVARAEGVDPTDIPQPLQAVVDPDALAKTLVSGVGDGGLTVTFPFRGYAVGVSDDGTVVVRASADECGQ